MGEGRGVIYICPFEQINEALLKELSLKISEKFKFKTEILPGLGLPTYAYDKERGQYDSAIILKKMTEVYQDDAVKILGVLDVDLFIPLLTFIIGQALLNDKYCLVSLCRLNPLFYGKPYDDELLSS